MKWKSRCSIQRLAVTGFVVYVITISYIYISATTTNLDGSLLRPEGLAQAFSSKTQQPQHETYPVSWHTNFFEVDSENELLEGSFIDTCLVNANLLHIKPYEDYWFKHRMPQFASVVLAPPLYNNMTHYWHIIFSTGNMKTIVGEAGIRKGRRHQWMRKGIWFCDDEPATPIGSGCPNGETLIVRCPQLGSSAPRMLSTSRENESYYIGAHVDCYRHKSFRKPPSTTSAIAANALLFGNIVLRHPRRLVEWIEYHRLIGVDHFFVYFMGSYDVDREANVLPNLPYITYIPYDLMNQSNFVDNIRDAFRFQPTQQMDVIFRARGLGYDWVLMHDMDEYLQFGATSGSLKSLTAKFLYDEYGNYTKIGGLSIQSTTFGAAHGEPAFPSLLIDHIYKRPKLFTGQRQKAIIRPGNVNYFAVHGITLGGKEIAVDPEYLRLAHYRHSELGVSLAKRPILDTSIRNTFHDALQSRVDFVWSLMRKKYNSPEDLWSFETGFHEYHHENSTLGQHSNK